MGLNNMATVKSIDELMKKVKGDISKKLAEERSLMKIKNVNRSSVSEEVYAVYNPIRYPRRADNGGLTDPDNITVMPSEVPFGVVLNITNDTAPKGFDKIGKESEFLAPIVEYGTGGRAPWQKPRPFMERTEEKLKNGNVIKNIIKEIDYIK